VFPDHESFLARFLLPYWSTFLTLYGCECVCINVRVSEVVVVVVVVEVVVVVVVVVVCMGMMDDSKQVGREFTGRNLSAVVGTTGTDTYRWNNRRTSRRGGCRANQTHSQSRVSFSLLLSLSFSFSHVCHETAVTRRDGPCSFISHTPCRGSALLRQRSKYGSLSFVARPRARELGAAEFILYIPI
jgi:hypothetical protein